MRTVLLVLALALVTGCGGAGQPSTQQSPTTSASPYVYTSRSPDGRWRLSMNLNDCKYLYLTPSSGGKAERFAAPSACGEDQGMVGGTWVAPHLLLIGDSFDVARINPATRTATLLASLKYAQVSPNGKWIAGNGPGDPEMDAEANTIYVVSVDGSKCFVVPGLSGAPTFTPNGQNVIVGTGKPASRRKFAITSLRPDCPTGINGILASNGSQSYVDVKSPGW